LGASGYLSMTLDFDLFSGGCVGRICLIALPA
jgi:hypothetical protein